MNALCAKIQRGLYQPGEKLPTEPEVMAEQGVITPTQAASAAAELWLK